MDLRRQLAIVRARLPLIALVVVVAAVAGYALAAIRPPLYEARATILIGQSLSAVNPDFNQLLTSQRLTVTYAELATRRPILEQVISALRLNVTPEALANRVYAEPSQTTAFLVIVSRGPDPAEAAAIANEVANRVIAASPTVSGQQVDLIEGIADDLRATRADIEVATAEVERLEAIETPTPQERVDLRAAQDRVASLRSTYATLLSFSSANGANLLTLVEPAVSPTDAAGPRAWLLTLLAATVGLMFALAVVFVIEYLDDSLKRPEEIEEVLGLPTLGSIGRLRGRPGVDEVYRLVTLLNPRSHSAEAYRSIRANVDFTSVDSPLKSLLVASATSGEGKTVTAANLAVVFAQAGRRVLLIDADLRRPGLDAIFRAPNKRGLTSLMVNSEMDPIDAAQSTEQKDLRILTTGSLPPNPAELLGSQRMATILEKLEAAYDLVIIDSPPIQAVADGAILSTLVDATLLVVDTRRGRRGSVVRARETLARAGGRVAGVVLNRVSRDLDADAYTAYGYTLTPMEAVHEQADPVIWPTPAEDVSEAPRTKPAPRSRTRTSPPTSV